MTLLGVSWEVAGRSGVGRLVMAHVVGRVIGHDLAVIISAMEASDGIDLLR